MYNYWFLHSMEFFTYYYYSGYSTSEHTHLAFCNLMKKQANLAILVIKGIILLFITAQGITNSNIM